MSAKYRDSDRDRRRGDKDPPRERDREPREPSGASGGRRSNLNEFFLSGEGINREVLQKEICKYLGPEAYSRPMKYNGIQGYMVTAVRPFTSEMVNDLVELSDAYVSEKHDARRRGYQDISYEQSRASRDQEAILRPPQEDPYQQDLREPRDPRDRYPPQTSYTTASSQSGYPAPVGANYLPPGQVGYPSPAYPQDVPYGSSAANYAVPPGYIPTSRQPAGGGLYTHEMDMDYRQPAYPQGRSGQPRMAEPPRADPGRYPPESVYRERLDRPLPSGYVSSQGDVMMQDEYYSAPSAGGRGFPPPRAAPTTYGSRESPQLRSDRNDPYRNEPIREERRRRG